MLNGIVDKRWVQHEAEGWCGNHSSVGDRALRVVVGETFALPSDGFWSVWLCALTQYLPQDAESMCFTVWDYVSLRKTVWWVITLQVGSLVKGRPRINYKEKACIGCHAGSTLSRDEWTSFDHLGSSQSDAEVTTRDLCWSMILIISCLWSIDYATGRHIPVLKFRWG